MLFVPKTLMKTIPDKNVPAGAALLLAFIGGIDAPKGYDVIYGRIRGSSLKPLGQ